MSTWIASLARRRWLLVLQLVLFLAVFLGARAWTQRDMVAGEAPPIDTVLLDGRPVSLQAYRGRPVLVHFWATWCKVCRLEQAAIQAIAEDWPVLTIALQSGDAMTVQRYLSEHSLSWDTIADPDGALAARYGVRGVPSSFVVGPDGGIRYREVGFTTPWGLRARLWLAAR
ncbi:MAG: protein disulfide oxidoreductase [Chromatiales bacterium]|jgi:thiol-disulfide isomerase/thioredoxin